MKKVLLPIVALMLIGFHFISASAEKPGPALRADYDGLAMTPPMGWYPWNTFGQEPQNEKLIKEMVEALIRSGMREAGYMYIGPDEGICFYRAEDGRLSVAVPPNDVLMLRLSRSKDFPLPPIISADTYLISLRSKSSKPEKLSASPSNL